MSRETSKWLLENVMVGYVNERGPAWHGNAGDPNMFDGPVPTEKALELFAWEAREATIDYTAQLTAADGAMTEIQRVDPNHKIYYRSDTGSVIGINGKSHQRHQYREWLLDNVEMILGAGLSIGQVGLLRGGAIAWVSIEMKDTLEYSGIKFRPQLTAATSFDASLKSTYQLMSTIAVCDNTLFAGLREKSPKWGTSHSKNSKFDVEAAREALGLVEAYGASFGRRLDELVGAKVSEQEFYNFIQLYVPMPKDDASKREVTIATKKRDTLFDLWETDAMVSPWRGTQFGVVQATNTYAHWHSIQRNAVRQERNMLRAVTSSKAESYETLDMNTLKLLATVQS